jgi:hypothetical protein
MKKEKKKFAERSVLTLDKEISFFAECNYLALNVQHLKYIKNNFEKYEIKKNRFIKCLRSSTRQIIVIC